jgi:undecaprenyl-diphosphatase
LPAARNPDVAAGFAAVLAKNIQKIVTCREPHVTIDFSPADVRRPTPEIRHNLVISSVLFVCAVALALIPEAFDRPTTRLINGFVNRAWFFDYFAEASGKYFTFSGVIMMAMIWYCWFENRDFERRVRILVGTLASIGAGGISRILQLELSTHPRPYFDPILNFQQPLNLEEAYNNWNSFPSDHVSVFAGLAVVLYIARPRFVIYAIAWTIIVECFRNYVGAHYPSDLVGGAALAALVVWASQMSWPISVGKKVMRWEQSSPGLFYMSACFFSFQIATLFNDIRQTLGPIRHHILGQ